MERWTILPTFAVRTTGFPIEMLEPLRLMRTTRMVHQLLTLESDLEQMRERMLGECLPRAVRQAAQLGRRQHLRELSLWRKQVNRRQRVSPPPGDGEFSKDATSWNAAIEGVESQRTAAHRMWKEEHEHARATLWRLATDPRLLEAIWLSNPDFYHTLVTCKGTSQRSSAVRRLERSLVTYVQRMCAKNETNSFFGPINYGSLDPRAARSVDFVRCTTLRARTSFATQWMAESLASAIGADARLLPYLKPRRGTRWRLLSPETLQDSVSGRRIRLHSADACLVRSADGTHTVADLSAALEADCHTVWERIERLEDVGVLVARLLVPGDRADPLGYLAEWLTAVPTEAPGRAHWLEIVTKLQREVVDLSGDALPSRIDRLKRIEEMFVAATGSAARRGDGAMYADRSLVFEEALGDLERFVVGGTLAETIVERLQPVLRLWRAAARLRAEQDQRAAHHVWMRALGSATDGSVPLLRFLAEARRGNANADLSGDRLRDLLSDLRELVGARSDGRCARISSKDLPIPELPPEEDACAYTSVDLLIDSADEAAVERGAFRLVLGEAHAPPLLWVFPTAHYAREALGETVVAALAAQPGAAVAAQVALARDTKIYPLPLPGRTIELRATHPECRALSAAEVDVRADGDGVSLWHGSERLRLYPPLKRREPADAFAGLGFPGIEMLTIETGPHTPRIEIDGVVYQRERWTLPGGPLSEPGQHDFELFVNVWRWKRRHALPDEVFVRVPNEPKPVYVDFRNHLLIEMFDHLSAQNDQLVITEMLPSSSGTWLQAPGGHYSAEYRVVAVADPPEDRTA